MFCCVFAILAEKPYNTYTIKKLSGVSAQSKKRGYLQGK